jgi:hypothetical protein
VNRHLNPDAAERRADALITVQRQLLKAERGLVGTPGQGAGDDVFQDLANLVTLVRWQCNAPDRKAIKAACKRLRKAVS